MAVLWTPSGPAKWQAYALDPTKLYRLEPGGLQPASADEPCAQSATVMLCYAEPERRWAIVGTRSAEVEVNGVRLAVGVRVLRDRDELRLWAGPDSCAAQFYFSVENLARVEPFSEDDRAVNCARCSQRIDPGQSAVRCPTCGVWHHQTDEYPCWAYCETCANCSQPTALDAGYRWTPEEL